MAAEHPGALRLQLAKDLPALPERVFAAFVEADQLRQWWGPAGFAVPHLRFNVAEGATFRITMQPPEGDVFHLGGTFRVVEAPTRLVFTFAWEEPDPDDQETVVALTLAAAGSGTRLVLDQRPFKTKPRWELHRDGWTDTFERLERFLG